MNKGLEALKKLSEMGYLNIPMPKPNVKWTDEDDKALGCAYDIEKSLKALDIIEENLKYGYVFIGYDKDNKPRFKFADTKLYEEIKKKETY